MELPKDYEKRIKNEAMHFSQEAKQAQKNSDKVERGFPIVEAFVEAHKIIRPYLLEHMPHIDTTLYILDYVNKNPVDTKIVSLGCGTGDWEIELIEKAPKKIRMELLEINEDVLKYAVDYAVKNNLKLSTIIQDANKLKLEKDSYDFIIVRSSLHHFLKLEHIFTEINNALTTNGKFLVIGEVIGKNGHLLYDETRREVEKIMQILPEKFRYNHNDKKTQSKYPSIDYAKDSFEGIRCEEIYSLLQKYLKPEEQVVFDTITTLLLDFRFGPNYDLANEFDNAVLNFIVQMDQYYLKNKILKPVALWGIYGKK